MRGSPISCRRPPLFFVPENLGAKAIDIRRQKKEKNMSEFTLDDGRKAEKVESNSDSLTKVTEIYVEPKPQRKLAQRVIERLCVCERETQTINEETGEILESVVENLCAGAVAAAVSEKTPMKKAVESRLLSQVDKTYYVFGLIIVAQLLALGYVLFFM